MRRLLLFSLLLTLPLASAAVPITLELSDLSPDSTNALRGGFISGARGILYADLDGSMISNVHGEIFVGGVGSVLVTDGAFDLRGDADSWLATDVLGDMGVSGFAIRGDNLRFLADYTQCRGKRCKTRWVRFYGYMDTKDPSIPEPSAALLFGLGTIILRQRVARGR